MLALLGSLATGETARIMRRMRVAVAVYALAAAAGLCGAGFLVGAAYIAAATRYGSFEAAFAFGVAFLALALLLLVVHRLVARRKARRDALYRSQEMKNYAGAAAVALLPALLRSRSGLVGLAAPLVAVAAYALYRENSGPPGPKPHDDA